MKVLGEGESNGAISILHALGLGRGCSIGIELTTKVQIVEDAVEIEDDRNGLLAAVEKCWRDRGLPTPDQFGWKVDSSILLAKGSSRAQRCLVQLSEPSIHVPGPVFLTLRLRISPLTHNSSRTVLRLVAWTIIGRHWNRAGS